MVLLFRDSSDHGLTAISAEMAGYDVEKRVLWFTSISGVMVHFFCPQPQGERFIREYARGYLDLSITSLEGVVEYG